MFGWNRMQPKQAMAGMAWLPNNIDFEAGANLKVIMSSSHISLVEINQFSSSVHTNKIVSLITLRRRCNKVSQSPKLKNLL